MDYIFRGLGSKFVKEERNDVESNIDAAAI